MCISLIPTRVYVVLAYTSNKHCFRMFKSIPLHTLSTSKSCPYLLVCNVIHNWHFSVHFNVSRNSQVQRKAEYEVSDLCCKVK